MLLGVGYAIGFYVTAFLTGIWDARYGIKFDCDDWIGCTAWPIFVSMLIVTGLVFGLSVLCEWTFSRIRSRFPAMARFVQKVLKYARTAIFVVSLMFRPAKLGEIVGKRIF